MRGYVYVVLILFAVCTVSCSVPARRQPIPDRPVIGGQISDVSDDAIVNIRVLTLAGEWVLRGTRMGSGPWRFVGMHAGSADYVVTAEAEGYVSQPISYTIHISGDTAYMVRNGQVTKEEAVHLDFRFVPKDSP